MNSKDWDFALELLESWIVIAEAMDWTGSTPLSRETEQFIKRVSPPEKYREVGWLG